MIIIDADGVITFRKEYDAPTLPNPVDILAEIDKMR